MNTAFFQKGFRPFFLLAAVFAAVWIPLWSWRFSIGWSGQGWSGSNWHAHEMVYGFLVAVIAGFLLTAAENWTQEKTAAGRALGVLIGIWVLGRVAMVNGLPSVWTAAVDWVFLPILAFFIARPIVKTKNKRNYVVVAILMILSGLNLASHVGMIAGSDVLTRRALLAAVFLVTTLVLLIAGRVIPFFTMNSLQRVTTSTPKLEKAVLLGSLVLVVLQAFPANTMTSVLMLMLGLIVLLRMRGWKTTLALKEPMLAILHMGHAWIGVGLIVRAIAQWTEGVTPNLGLHIITMGGLSTVSLGMMVRVSLGHTGRQIRASLLVKIAFISIHLGVVARTILPMVVPDNYVTWVAVGSSLWALAFGIYVVGFTRLLFEPRPDGRPG
ncbi:MAG: NnrS family protein [bacterium]